MHNISFFSDCYGCGVCAIACPKKIITLRLQDGFYQPSVKNDDCVGCNICLSVCSFYHEEVKNHTGCIRSYAAYSNDDKIRYHSSSGGIGYELAKNAISEGYIFCGVRYNIKKGRAEHYLVEKEEDLDQSIGSKYIQSYSFNGFSQIIKGRKYMVVGTPCQIDSLRRYIKKKGIEDSFVLIDFFCHGVPSGMMWQKYKEECGLPNSIEVKWRDKRTGWHDSWNMIFRTQNDESSSLMSQGDLFYKFFLKNRCLGKACYDHCKYKMANSSADIRIGDLWGSKYQKDENGVSGVLTFTTLGDNFLHQLKSCTIIPEELETVTESQMKYCPRRPSSYKYVMKELKKGTNLKDIDRHASRIEFLFDELPHNIMYYSRRIIAKLLCR